MTITASAATSAAASAQLAPTGQNATHKLNADFNLFLSLLTTQMKNQDPLDPVDSAQYTQQLVQYSAVEQAIEQTGTLKEIRDRLDSIEAGLTPAAADIGASVVATSVPSVEQIVPTDPTLEN